MMNKGDIYKELLRNAKKTFTALAAFNIHSLDSLYVLADYSKEINKPIIAQTSSGIASYYSPEVLARIVRALNSSGSRLFLHLDHCNDLALIKACIEAKYDSVMIDGSYLPLVDNIELTGKVVSYAKAEGCLVEGEIGVLEGIEDNLGGDANLTLPEEALEFALKTGVDLLAPAIGNVHGEYSKKHNRLDFKLLKEISQKVPCPLVLHGGTGLTDNELHLAVSMGIVKVNISTAMKNAFRKIFLLFQQGEDNVPASFVSKLNNEYRSVMKKHIDILDAKSNNSEDIL